MMKKIAYLRVSTPEQCVDRQIDGLKGLCDELHVERLSAVSRKRPVYDAIVDALRPGDMLVIWDLDRAYRSARDALNELDALEKRGVNFFIANLNLDTTTPHGKLLFTVMSGIAEFERDFLVQRTKEGIAAARARGARLGRPPKLTDIELSEAGLRVASGERLASVGRTFGVSGWTLARSLKRSRMISPVQTPVTRD